MSSFRSTLALGVIFLAACSSKNDNASATVNEDTAAVATTPSMDSSMAMNNGSMDMSGMAMTGDSDRDFLRMMSDHHKGLVLLAHETNEKSEPLSVKSDATKLDSKQDAELEKMAGILKKDYNDSYEPKVMPDNQAMADELKPLSGKAYEKKFLEHVVMHHQQAIKMIDEYLPKAKRADIKSMAEKMKADQTKEIKEFQAKISKLG